MTSEHGVTSSMQYYARKYPKYRLTEIFVRRWKNQYCSTFKNPKQSSTEVIEDTSDTAEDCNETTEGSTKQIQRMKTGRPLLIEAELDAQV